MIDVAHGAQGTVRIASRTCGDTWAVEIIECSFEPGMQVPAVQLGWTYGLMPAEIPGYIRALGGIECPFGRAPDVSQPLDMALHCAHAGERIHGIGQSILIISGR